MSTIDFIKNILIEQIKSYRMLLELLQREREYLVNLDVNGVERLSKEKDTLLLKLRLLEEERIRLIKTFTADNAIRETITLQELSELTADDDFRIMRSQLKSLLQSIQELNDFNMILIARSLSVVRHSVGFLESFGLFINQSNTGIMLSKEI
jgi:flagellar biosynthesis/type III secretory pathway chaperone